MQLRNYSDEQVRISIDKLRERERETLRDILLHLKEIDRRKLFSKWGFSCLFTFAVKHLKYSEDQAGRRIAAMRLIRDLPELEEKVANGTLTLSALSQAQWHFRKVRHTTEEKRAILAQLENASKREIKKILTQEESKITYYFEADAELEKIVERLKGLHPHLNFNQLMEKVCKMALEKVDPKMKIERSEVRALKKTTTGRKPILIGKDLSSRDYNAQVYTSAGKVVGEPIKGQCGNPAIARSSSSATRRYIAAPVKREVWKRAGGKCQICESTFALEIDHILPFGRGGANDSQNLRLLCRNCNQRKAIETYGARKMEKFLT